MTMANVSEDEEMKFGTEDEELTILDRDFDQMEHYIPKLENASISDSPNVEKEYNYHMGALISWIAY